MIGSSQPAWISSHCEELARLSAREGVNPRVTSPRRARRGGWASRGSSSKGRRRSRSASCGASARSPRPGSLRAISASVSRKCAPAAETTFSSIIRLPKSLAPKRSETWPIFAPWVTQEACTFGKLSSMTRATASVRRYWKDVSSSPASAVFVGLEGPGDESGEAAGPVLQVAQVQQVLDPLLERLDVAEHHRGRGASSRAGAPSPSPRATRRSMPLAMPMIFAHAVGQDLGAAAGDRVEPRGHQPAQGLLEAEASRPRTMCCTSAGDSPWIQIG